MNLPHGKLLLFAKEILQKDKKFAKVKCEFPFIPTFAMGLEASAQSSAALSKERLEAFLAGANGVERLKEFDKKSYIVNIEKIYSLDNMELFYFQMEDYMRGKFAIYIQ